MKIYTKTGDAGQTGLFGGPRVSKDHARIEAYGTVDELNSALGVARAAGLPTDVDAVIARIQHELFSLGAQLATPTQAAGSEAVGENHVRALEADIDRFEANLPPLKEFILPGGTQAAAMVHLARTICRRAERRLVTLLHQPTESVSVGTLVYLNRVGDLLFVLAREVNRAAGLADVPWRSGEG